MPFLPHCNKMQEIIFTFHFQMSFILFDVHALKKQKQTEVSLLCFSFNASKWLVAGPIFPLR